MFVELKDRGILMIKGKDRQAFLQGLITNDVCRVNSNQSLYSALLTPQGKYLFNFFIFEKNEVYYNDCSLHRLPELMKKFSLYKLRSEII